MFLGRDRRLSVYREVLLTFKVLCTVHNVVTNWETQPSMADGQRHAEQRTVGSCIRLVLTRCCSERKGVAQMGQYRGQVTQTRSVT